MFWGDKIFSHGMKTNIPKNLYDLQKLNSTLLCYEHRQYPKSMVNSCIGFADSASAYAPEDSAGDRYAKPDGIIIDIEGLENVQLGKGGELQPLEP